MDKYFFSDRHVSVEEEIDGRGKFDRRELENELRHRSWDELENVYGVSRHKINEILRRADVNRDGEIEYREFLEVIKRYRLTTEQEGTLKELVAAFAYAEEFSCMPPTVFMLSITLIELAFFLYLSIHLTLGNVEIRYPSANSILFIYKIFMISYNFREGFYVLA